MAESVSPSVAIADLQQRIKDLALRKHELHLELQRVDLAEKHLTAECGFLMNENAVISKLPRELLIFIFELGVAQTYHESYSGQFVPFELLVSSVTRRWRQIAIESPSLWTHIYSYPNSFGMDSQTLSTIQMYVQRSKSSPLNIELGLRDEPQVVDILCNNVARWQRISIFVENFKSFQTLGLLTERSPAPLLEYLSIIPGGVDMPSIPPASLGEIRLFQRAPRLAFIRLRGFMTTRLPLGRVTTLHLDNLPGHRIPALHATLAACPNLRNLSIIHPSSGLDVSPPLSLPFLRALRVMTNPIAATTILSFLESIQADSLESVELVDFTMCNERVELPPIRPFPSVRDLTLSECSSDTDSPFLLGLFPNIHRLSLMGSCSPELLELCSVESTQTLTNLKYLQLEQLETAQESLLCAGIVSGRKLKGLPLMALELHRDVWNKFSRKGRLEWLRQAVQLDRWERREDWPPGSSESIDDYQDTLF